MGKKNINIPASSRRFLTENLAEMGVIPDIQKRKASPKMVRDLLIEHSYEPTAHLMALMEKEEWTDTEKEKVKVCMGLIKMAYITSAKQVQVDTNHTQNNNYTITTVVQEQNMLDSKNILDQYGIESNVGKMINVTPPKKKLNDQENIN